jgi:hypothetical protein
MTTPGFDHPLCILPFDHRESREKTARISREGETKIRREMRSTL